MAERADVAVVGAGFAGLSAARDCTAAGLDTVLLEARDRPGGRAWTRRHPSTDELVELGGAYFTESHRHVAAELARYDIGTRVHELPAQFRWHTAGAMRHGMPVPAGEWSELERVIGVVQRDVAGYASGETATAALSLHDYLERLETTEAVRDFLFGWSATTLGAPASSGAVADAFASIHDHGGLTGLVRMIQFSPSTGWSAVAAAMMEDAAAEVRLGTPVSTVERGAAGFKIRAGAGTVVACSAVILAVPINCLPAITFEPRLPSQVSAVFGSNAGAAVKLLVRARWVEPRCWAVGRGLGIDQFIYDRVQDGVSSIVGFGARDERFDFDRRGDVEQALHVFYPEAELLDWQWHDWNTDPFSLGTWVTTRAGHEEAVHQDRIPTEGRLVFATSDLAPESAGWIDGALSAGSRAARAVIVALGSSREEQSSPQG